MAKEICISTTPHETRLAILEDDQLAEIYYERENEYTLAGSIYKGRVTRVLPGMQSSFVDVGLERDAFLYVTDFLEEQEDSEEYASEGNGRSRESRPGPEPAEEPVGRAANGDRHPERNPDRADRNQDRGGRRPALPAPQPEAAREPAREGGRAGRERAREQAAAPLREAVPAAQDLEEKGDEESPEGTRRWRGRRGRRRGVRGGLPQAAAPRPLLSDTPKALEEAGESEEAVAPSSIAEHGAPGGVEPVHTVSASRQEESSSRTNAGRDRSSRRSREPYAQHSTLDRPAPEPDHSSHESAPRANGGSPATGGTIVLPGESLSKYGSAPADPSVPPVAPTATVPKTLRPVNYIAPKPSTLVELSGDWDGGAVMPGETLSRYREPAAISLAAPAADDYFVESAAIAETAPNLSAEFTPADAGVDPIAAPAQEASPAVYETAHETVREEPVPFEQEAAQGGDAHGEFAAPAPAAHEEPAVLGEPEIVAAALSPEAEAHAPQVAEPEIAHAPESLAAQPEPSEPAEYDPENASASYRVQLGGASELRMPSPEAPEAAPTYEAEPETWAEPIGQFAESDRADVPEAHHEPAGHPHADVPEFGGTLATATDVPVEPSTESLMEPKPWPASAPAAPPLQILHEDGSVDLAAAHEANFPPQAGSHPDETEPEPSPIGEFEAHLSPAAEAQQAEAEFASLPTPSIEFSDLVDRMQGFAPGAGLLEEETIDEEEYDFEPLYAHAEDGDQEDLEEETLDQHMEPSALSDAVRESHLEQRVHQVPQAAAPVVEEEEAGFGYEEVEEGDEDFDEAEEGEEAAQSTESTEAGERQDTGRGHGARSDEGRARGRGRSNGGRNSGRRNGPGRGRSAQSQDLPIISELLKQGQEILVQIAKEPIAKKGARITSHIALPGRFLVFMPTVSHVGVSRKIASDEERQRLKRILISEKGDSSGGFIVRTAAEGASEEDLRADLRFLISLWTEIKQRSDTAKAPALIYHDLNLIERILRDQVSSNFSTIWVDSEAEYERIIRFLSRFQPQLVRRVKLYTKETPLFEHFGIQEEISKALKSKVWLKSGGSIVINQTEALVAIDINTGKYVGKTSRLEDTIVKTNLDAIPEIVRQIRLRDLGGIIVIDFIDMDERKNRNRVLAALEEELKNDRAPSKVLQFNDFGLVAITRKRVKQSLERTLSVTCETCTGTGMVKSPITVCNEIYTEMRKMQKHLDGKDVMLRVNPEVVKQLKAGNGKWINELEEMVTKTIIIKSDPALHPEQFDIH